MAKSKKIFDKRAEMINQYIREWNVAGFYSPSMHSNLEWIHGLDIEYDSSTFDTDPFEPHPEGVKTIFPFWKQDPSRDRGYVELPYTLPQDFTLFVLMRENTIDIWKKKLDWIVDKRGMALLVSHPDYMNFSGGRCKSDEYPKALYQELLDYIKDRYEGQYWNPLPREMARFWKNNVEKKTAQSNFKTG